MCVLRQLSPRDWPWKKTWGGTEVRRDKDGDRSQPQHDGDKEDEP